MALKRAADPIDHPGDDRFGLMARKLDRDRAEERIRARRIERRGEIHEHVEFGIAQAEQGTPLPRWRGAR